MTLANNIIEFPKNSVKPKNANDEKQLIKSFEENKKIYVDHLVEHYTHQLINKLGMHGFDVYENEFLRNYFYNCEVLRMVLYDSLNIYHPLKEHVKETIDKFEKEDINTDI